MSNNSTYTDETEMLYRRILPNKLNDKTPDHYFVEPSGKIRIKSPAFLGGKKPSVDRAKLIGCNPNITRARGKPTDGIILMISSDIKSIHIGNYIADVKIAPLPGNPAHAEIVLTPETDNVPKSVLSKLRKQLARKATCIVHPIPLK